MNDLHRLIPLWAKNKKKYIEKAFCLAYITILLRIHTGHTYKI